MAPVCPNFYALSKLRPGRRVSGMIATMTRWVGPVVGVLLVLLGGLWTLQGVGVVGGSFMTGSRLWLVIGLVLVVAGVALLLRLGRRPRGVR